MTDIPKEQLVITPLDGCEPEIGRWLWAFEDTRRRTRRSLEGIHPLAVDWRADSGGHTIGTLLYHIGAIEASWLYEEVLQQEFTPRLKNLFPHEVRDKRGRLTVVKWGSISAHWQRLDTVRLLLLETYRAMKLADFRRPRSLPDYEVTPEWVLHHLMQHEAGHRDEIEALRQRAEQSLSLGG